MTSTLSFAQAGERRAGDNVPAVATPAQPGLWARLSHGFGADRAAQAAAIAAHREAVGATLYRLAALAEGVANEGHRSVEACTNLARQSKGLSEGLVESEGEIDRIARIAAENATASQALQTEMKQTAEQLDDCVGQSRNRAHLVEDLFRSVERSRTGFNEVNTCVDEVERFLTIVHEIGSQAGLLALNAAIEASSAGEHGQGFFVVASEMRRLADKTAATIEQTRRMTERMRASTAAASELIATACLAAKPSQQRGEQLMEAIVSCSETVRHAERSAEKFTRASQQQIEAVAAMHKGLRGMRSAAHNCTFDADATAEMSMSTLELQLDSTRNSRNLGTISSPTIPRPIIACLSTAPLWPQRRLAAVNAPASTSWNASGR